MAEFVKFSNEQFGSTAISVPTSPAEARRERGSSKRAFLLVQARERCNCAVINPVLVRGHCAPSGRCLRGHFLRRRLRPPPLKAGRSRKGRRVSQLFRETSRPGADASDVTLYVTRPVSSKYYATRKTPAPSANRFQLEVLGETYIIIMIAKNL
ncbi:hypothetical protein EVAR_8205_1 [Eumeta japonica]|uniref:Uncharacterized protein n=1 Tax=Eumeta variegata TaxID=151549 RepID=A0A4C1TFM8_EUMVA|nr:hypothetical protein EVAR_8205_1 [Eumeta japonica]